MDPRCGSLYMGNNCGERENKITTKISERINFTPVCSGILPKKTRKKRVGIMMRINYV